MLIKPMKYLLSCLALLGGSMVLAQDFSAIVAMPSGQVLSQEQFKALGTLPSVELDGRSYWVLPLQAGGEGSVVIDGNLRLGRTGNQVSIVEQPTDKVRSQLSAVLSKAKSVKYYDHMSITLVRYATLQQAIQGLVDIRAAMPGAAVGLPISFSQPRSQ